jgi:hypothetical protein
MKRFYVAHRAVAGKDACAPGKDDFSKLMCGQF